MNKLIVSAILLSLTVVVLYATAPVVLACNSSGNQNAIDYTDCSGNDIYWFNQCNERLELYKHCGVNQICQNALCVDQNIGCRTNLDCGTDAVYGSAFCQGNNVYQNYKTYTCNNPGTSSSTCSSSITARLQTTCYGSQACTNGSCTSSCTQNYQQRCIGTSMYWYDSCGTQGNYVGTCGQTNSTLTVTKTVKDITTNTAFSTSTYASPSDMLLYMITLQANGTDAQNVYVRDILPVNLIYNNQLVVARSNNSYNSYSGDVMSGLNLNTISSGQTVTITYQVQVASSTNFIYGTTTLNNTVTTTSSNVSYVPNATASVIVTKSGVLGASYVSTGLTNNFWVDSFFLPLLITVIGLWMWKLGMFFGIEKWLDSKRKVRRGYHAQKELLNRIEKIQKVGK